MKTLMMIMLVLMLAAGDVDCPDDYETQEYDVVVV